ncbi:hypothetical protein B4064_3309 [Caldibacillus thermoamylovorans]|jgi:hypothetical protein|uniref:Uncharacterized protein n=1 Tax=Caldibacillus thermoamylovorans TaxID=35841 RepID=A0A0D0F9L6_9BACI|nr:hypothetical protein B4065_3590 [Caldibacillus thermoamylovorans]KIO62007.1 hypothetical protein B4064_3309 [Caldibacillus thermoamylovorans]KIO64347.1 hypothetical protein B4166_0024 [Caldibacillus thermoamylovorans]KIO73641.1 hypothetical protein B4167_0059 [Caldibacillus thermoamylovorans]
MIAKRFEYRQWHFLLETAKKVRKQLNKHIFGGLHGFFT